MCLQNCSIGCTTTGCGRTEIAVNEVIVLQFSEPVDPATVTTSSIRFLTPSSAQPVGQYFVNGTQVQFVPTLEFAGGQAFLGFAPGEVYTMTIPGGDGLGTLRSTSGKPFASTLSCPLTVSRGVFDRNGIAPSARVVVPEPNFITNAPRDTRIVLEFNELIDNSGFQGQSETPVRFSFRRTRATQQGETECDPESPSTPLIGNQLLTYDAGRDISVLTFQPSTPLPSDICVDIDITDGVRDLSNRSAQPQRLTFRTERVPLVEDRIEENFDGPEFLDADASAAQWTGGSALFRRIGGDGRHGPFRLSMATEVGMVGDKRRFVLNCNQTFIPLESVLPGGALVVEDGRFYFSEMVVPANVSLGFVGDVPPVISVAGRLEILGDIDVSGESIEAPPVVPPSDQPAVGQAGGAGGIMGGRGGKGGDRVAPGVVTPANQGVAGEEVWIPTGYAYAGSAAGTGGRGSATFPTSGNTADFHFSSTISTSASCITAAAGGGGGGYVTAGQAGQVVSNNQAEGGITTWRVGSGSTLTTLVSGTASDAPLVNPPYPWPANRYAGLTIELRSGAVLVASRTIVSHATSTLTSATFQVTPAWPTVPTNANTFTIVPPANPPAPPLVSAIGPAAAGGTALQLFPVSGPSSRHFLIGGSGGGGSGNQGAFARRSGTEPRAFAQGSGGGGGGGAVALRAGNALVLAADGRLLARGGSAANNVSTTVVATTPQPAPGGGGSGGSLLLQSGGDVVLAGLVDVRGGNGGDLDRFGPDIFQLVGLRLVSEGGDGSPGFIRLETAVPPTLQLLANAQPPAASDNIAPLNDTDAEVACRSLYYYTNVPFGPQYVRYEIAAIVDGQSVLLSDDPAISSQPASESAPVRAYFQCARLDPITREVRQIRPWRRSVRNTSGDIGIAADNFNSFRFHLIANRAIAASVTIDRVAVVFRR